MNIKKRNVCHILPLVESDVIVEPGLYDLEAGLTHIDSIMSSRMTLLSGPDIKKLSLQLHTGSRNRCVESTQFESRAVASL